MSNNIIRLTPPWVERIRRKLAAGRWGDRGQFPDRERSLWRGADGAWTVIDDGGGFFLGDDDDLADFEKQMDAQGWWASRR